jgi:hypothetical protein
MLPTIGRQCLQRMTSRTLLNRFCGKSVANGRQLSQSMVRSSKEENKPPVDSQPSSTPQQDINESLQRQYIRPRRALLYCPGSDDRKVAKLSTICGSVDTVVLDCEDGVAANKKVSLELMFRFCGLSLSYY